MVGGVAARLRSTMIFTVYRLTEQRKIPSLVIGGSRYAVLAPLWVEGAACSTAGLSFDDDELRLRLAVDFGDREKLPFPVVSEILLEVGFSPEFTRHVY